MSGIHFGIPVHMETHVFHLWIPVFAGMTGDEVSCKIEYLKRTHLGQFVWAADDVLSAAEGPPGLPLLSPGIGHTGTCAAHVSIHERRSHLSGIHFGIPADMESHICHVKIEYLKRTHFSKPSSAPGISSKLFGIRHFAHRKAAKRPTGTAGLKRTHLRAGCTRRRFQPKLLEPTDNSIVNARSEPTGNAGLKRTHLGRPLWAADDVLSAAEGHHLANPCCQKKTSPNIIGGRL